MVVCSKLGMNFVACGPKECMPADDVIEACKPIAERQRLHHHPHQDPKEACTGAHVIYTDVWVSMGEPDEVWTERINQLEEPYRVTTELMAMADPSAIFLHCLPGLPRHQHHHRCRDRRRSSASPRWRSRTRSSSPQSKVFDEAENRMHTIKAVMYATPEVLSLSCLL